jgi:hypothetical protein
MQRQLGDSQAMTHNSTFGQLLTHHKISGIYTPEEQLTIDEAIYPFLGRISFRVYIRENPHRYWIKMYELCDAKSGTSTIKKYLLWPEAAFEGGKWGDRPRPRP